ncbi:TetR/AcrR family transcriptional regulator [Pleomorphomonas sp. JP5]|uniref:TetR/AcrR family transcriptional regulator n=1 Tax=Pleomorphomonas sp. JP5 TaxID=2942998 RepID=UPI0020433526|nr:TetR/AcrR family transcriptional regulator [Pleomorphomonas sp. JP5]MCM5557064.1 TetR/AcrR family transcriptional regulator [Pleomorphomonas sp. JP5]
MSRNRFDNLSAERQKALFEAAAEEFAAKGFDAASLNRILEKSGMSKSSLYYYFDDKADLFVTLIERALSVLFGQIGAFETERLTAETYWSDITLHYKKAVAVVGDNDWLVRFGGLFYQLRGDPKRGGPTGRLFEVIRRWTKALIERGQAVGVVRDDLPISMLIEIAVGLFETLDRWVVANWADLSEAERQALPEVHVGLFRNLLGQDQTVRQTEKFG